jgi:adenylate cyclase class 2
MTDQYLEVEAKFLLNDRVGYERRLRSIGASLVQPRTHEMNYRFDLPDRSLSKESRVLRLRQDQNTVITYKDAALPNQPVSMRREIELKVYDFDDAKNLLEALGYQVYVIYEKYRTIYTLNDLEITIDELPYGVFTEIEGGDARRIEHTAASLSLLWSHRILSSYLVLFEHLRQKKDLKAPNLTFADFKGLSITSEDLGIKAADTSAYL